MRTRLSTFSCPERGNPWSFIDATAEWCHICAGYYTCIHNNPFLRKLQSDGEFHRESLKYLESHSFSEWIEWKRDTIIQRYRQLSGITPPAASRRKPVIEWRRTPEDAAENKNSPGSEITQVISDLPGFPKKLLPVIASAIVLRRQRLADKRSIVALYLVPEQWTQTKHMERAEFHFSQEIKRRFPLQHFFEMEYL